MCNVILRRMFALSRVSMIALAIITMVIILGGQDCEATPIASNFDRAANQAYLQILHFLQQSPTTDCSTDPVPPQCIYWQLGNAFDTTLDYALVHRDTLDVNKLGQAAINSHNALVATPDACWYDDFGWWAVASERALAPKGLWTNKVSTGLSRIAGQSWLLLQNGLTVGGHEEENFSPFKPKFVGGIWNYFWSTTHLDGVCQTPCDPNGGTACGRENSVTNGLYLDAALLRFQSSGDPYYGQSAGRELTFLSNWFNPANFTDPADQPLLFNLGGSLTSPAVVRERVGVFANGDVDSAYDPDLAWAGDQGLMLGALVRFVNGSPHDPRSPQMLALAIRITDGVLEYLTDQTRNQFFPWSRTDFPTADTIGSAPNAGDTGSYNTGLGVYMRYLMFAYNTNRTLKRHLIVTGYPRFVGAVAQNIVNSGGEGLCYPKANSCNDLVRATNQLAIMMAADEMRQ